MTCMSRDQFRSPPVSGTSCTSGNSGTSGNLRYRKLPFSLHYPPLRQARLLSADHLFTARLAGLHYVTAPLQVSTIPPANHLPKGLQSGKHLGSTFSASSIQVIPTSVSCLSSVFTIDRDEHLRWGVRSANCSWIPGSRITRPCYHRGHYVLNHSSVHYIQRYNRSRGGASCVLSLSLG